jgi:hypothetical protein
MKLISIVAALVLPALLTGAKPRPATNTVNIVARDFSFSAPRSIPAGVTTFRLFNKGPQIHHAQLLRLYGKHTAKDFVAALKPNAPEPDWATPVGGPNAVAPGGSTEITESLEPGRYAIVCFVDTPDHMPHVMKGMAHDLIVTPSKRSTALPAEDLTISLVDYNFELSKPLAAGQQRITITNKAEQPHEVLFVKLAPGKSGQDFLGWLDKMQGPPPGMPLGGVAGLTKGKPVSFALNVTSGDYVLICFMPDVKDGKPHFMKGMIQTVHVS